MSDLENFCLRPSLYIGKHSVYGLQCFISGLDQGNSNMFFDDIKDSSQFEIWVREKIRPTYNKKSFEHALEEADWDDRKAFGIWMDWFKEYRLIPV